ncbi:hypothetical protein [Wenxinia saemankumensis]|uniref:Uncharacterized protein n=1 Tax=Wenxinia saemankumensis TaxID=1447782 RepID=A0A1M6HQI4_9RHOB|nr:hypothetical protein [Wenxinia saemankumensis]SHJ24403.1 hypothetical protein SAMN05444417_3294 [Wenxinia saemankumensis]
MNLKGRVTKLENGGGSDLVVLVADRFGDDGEPDYSSVWVGGELHERQRGETQDAFVLRITGRSRSAFLEPDAGRQ